MCSLCSINMCSNESGIDLNFDTLVELNWDDFDAILKEATEKGFCQLNWKHPAHRRVLVVFPPFTSCVHRTAHAIFYRLLAYYSNL